MKTIGLLGGMSWKSTASYYKAITGRRICLVWHSNITKVFKRDYFDSTTTVFITGFSTGAHLHWEMPLNNIVLILFYVWEYLTRYLHSQ